MSPQVVIVLLALLMGLQPVTTDLYLPALPALGEDLGAPMAQVQFTLSGLLLAFGCSQLVWGPLADRFGRRPILLISLAGYVASALACTLAPSIGWLIVWRVLQGAAMGASVMGARAVIRDLYPPTEGARVMSTALSGLALIACVSAPLGGLLTQWLGWRAALALVVVFSAGTLALVALRFQETLPPQLARPSPSQLLRDALTILKTPSFQIYSLVAAGTYGGLFTYLATSSFVFIKLLGLSKTQYGLVMSSVSLSYLGGTFLCRWLLRRWGLQVTLRLGALFSLSGGLSLAFFAWHQAPSVLAIMLPAYLYMLGHSVLQPCSQMGTVMPFPQAAGTASALNGFCMMVAAFATGAWLSAHVDGSTGPLVQGVLFWSSVSAFTVWTLAKRYQPHAPQET